MNIKVNNREGMGTDMVFFFKGMRTCIIVYQRVL